MISTEFLGFSYNKEFFIDGVNIFEFHWLSTGECVTVLDPESKLVYTFSIYKVNLEDRNITFANGRFEDGRNAFYRVFEN